MKILMVCLGNICRSPLAHGIMESLVKEKGLDWEVDSAGTGHWHIGEPPDRRSVAIARKYGVDISAQCCRLFDPSDFGKFDRIYVMDRMNLRDILGMAKTDADRKKVRLLLDKEVVPDPYYEDDQFDPVYQMIEKGCRRIIEEELRGN
ncbi:protein-tyrosine phosphatase [Arcticibacter tournemirensis]|uniref:protein-tyrosine-phosphatase n=1 Tax=Arcticibacter tournemirensis TaxID=699437 RepID=A0A5M9HES6_9SPHI|nr:low molecular weight protein-tyrosine-phosphatase [Arcticibacter tournemirensis]KAA8485486.1 low molecular weight phosphotyrosine protein phosphatase [Arcticibacter tournemirensis]TQM48811.1 protein-tyrosine phosphatase [Arcticibacter tournemirensis]